MLYLLHTNGEIEELAGAVDAEIDDENRCLVCLDAGGAPVASYPVLAITMFSKEPFPTPDDAV